MLSFWVVFGIIVGVVLNPSLTLGIVLICFGAPTMGILVIIYSIIKGLLEQESK